MKFQIEFNKFKLIKMELNAGPKCYICKLAVFVKLYIHMYLH